MNPHLGLKRLRFSGPSVSRCVSACRRLAPWEREAFESDLVQLAQCAYASRGLSKAAPEANRVHNSARSPLRSFFRLGYPSPEMTREIEMRRTTRMLWAGLAACILGLLTLPQAAAEPTPISVECGDTIGPGGSWRITEDIGPCEPVGPALRIVGPVRVDLAGHTIDCGHDFELDQPLGLDIAGRGARVSNGTIDQCRRGVRVRGEGRHRVTDVTFGHLHGLAYEVVSDRNLVANVSWTGRSQGALVSGHRNRIVRNRFGYRAERYGIRVTGDSNRIARNDIDAEDYGVELLGDDNRLYRNKIYGHHELAIKVAGNRNRVRRNEASGNNGGCALIQGTRNLVIGNDLENYAFNALSVGGERNRARGNTAIGGVSVWGNDNTLERNVVRHNGSWRTATYRVRGTGHSLKRNTSIGHGSRTVAGFEVSGSLNSLIGNRVQGGHLAGFWVQEGALGNRLQGNHSTIELSSSVEEDYGVAIDLRDDNPGCGTNQWVGNRYGTVNQSCAEGTPD